MMGPRWDVTKIMAVAMVGIGVLIMITSISAQFLDV